jgi:hypothetical protein
VTTPIAFAALITSAAKLFRSLIDLLKQLLRLLLLTVLAAFVVVAVLMLAFADLLHR